MILNSVRLEDFISHKKTIIDLAYGINVVVGPNGAGKTSILDAISFALFNDYSNRGKKENLINSGARRCRVGLAFTEGGIPYDVEWSMERKRSAHGSLFRYKDGKRSLLARDGERSVVPEIEKILGLDKNMFSQSIYVRQGEIEALVTARPGERKELISKLLGVEDLEAAWGNIKTVIQTYHDIQIELKSEVDQKTVIEKERKGYETKSKELEESLAAIREDLDEIESKIQGTQIVLEQLKGKKKAFDGCEKEKSIIEENIANIKETLEKEKDELTTAVQAEEVLNRLRDDVSKLHFLDDYVRSLAVKDKQEIKLQSLQGKLNEIEQLTETVEQNSKNYELYREKEQLLKEKKKERRKYEGADTAEERARKRALECEREKEKRESNLNKELEKCSKALGENVDVDNVEAVLERKNKELQDVAEQLDKRTITGTGAVSVLEERMKELDENLSKLSNESLKTCPTCETELSPERLKQLIDRFSSEKGEANTKLIELKDDLKKVNMEKRQNDQKTRKINAVDPETAKNLFEELTKAIDNLTHQRTEVEELGKQAAALKKIDEDIELIEGERSRLEESYKEFYSAKHRLDSMPSKAEIEDELKPIRKALAEASRMSLESLEKLGYEPKEPQRELEELRKKKERYDQNTPIAKRKAEYESRVEATTRKFSDLRKKHSEIVRAIEKLGYNEEEHNKKQVEYESEIKSKSEIEKETVRIEQAKTSAEDEARKCREKLKTLEEKAEEKKAVDRFIGVLNRIRDAYGKDGIQKMIRARARPLLEKSTRDLFERFNLAYSDIKIDDDYNISVIGPIGVEDIDQISGGERVALAIALRLAIAQVLSEKVETIIMDEPTTHLDEERRKELVNILNTFFREGGRIIPQMLIITHHPEIEDVADVVYAVSKKEGYSTAESGHSSVSDNFKPGFG